MNPGRFLTPSSFLTTGVLLKRGRNALSAALGAAVAMHAVWSQLKTVGPQYTSSKPLTTQFVKRQPRLTKPLELKKRPRPRRRSVRRKTVAVKARADRRGAPAAPGATPALQRLARPSSSIGRDAAYRTDVVEPSALSGSVESTKQPKGALDSALELLEVETLDTGAHHAMVIQDPSDKRNIKGFFHIGAAYSESIARANAQAAALPAAWAIRGLAGAMNRYTQIRTDVTDNYTFDSKELLRTPFTLASSHWGFDHTASEARNLGEYLTCGGFFVADARHPQTGPQRPPIVSFRRMIVHALGLRGAKLGREWLWERLPNDHPLYHCYFDFESIPAGVDNVVSLPYAPLDYLEGVTVADHLVVVLSTKCYTAIWGVDASSSWGRLRDRGRQLQLGVNLIAFALTQEGSITQQVMDSVQ